MNVCIILMCISIIMVNISIIKLEKRLWNLENNSYIKWAKQMENRLESFLKENE